MAPPQYDAQIATLQTQVQMLIRDQEETRKLMRENQQETKEDIQEIKNTIKPLGDAFQRAKGFQGAVYVFVTLVLLGLGAGAKSLVEWLLNGVRP
jgi:hypothetical protein